MSTKIDEYIEREKSPQARRQMKKRVSGSQSVRQQPLQFPDWAVPLGPIIELLRNAFCLN